MSTSIHVPINPELLIWARESAGYDLDSAATRIGIGPEKLEGIEAGAIQITYSQLKRAAEVYKRSLAAFFMTKPPAPKEAPRDFRMQPDMASRPLSPALNYELRKAWRHREDVIELAEQMGKVIPAVEFSTNIEQQPEAVAEEVRHYLKINIEDQRTWRNQRSALNNWKNAIEDSGILVFEASRIATEEMRGVSLWSERVPVIILNGADSLAGRTFTLIHEFTHILLRQGGVCDLAPIEFDSQAARIEMFCNAVAGATLVPKNELRGLLAIDHAVEWPIEALEELANHFYVSKEVILRRLLILGLSSESHYREMRQIFLEEYRRLRDESRRGAGGPSPAVMAVRNLGKPYVRLVLSAYHDNMIGLATVSDYLGLKIKHLPRVESLVMNGR